MTSIQSFVKSKHSIKISFVSSASNSSVHILLTKMSSQKPVTRQYNVVAQLLRDCDLYDEFIVLFEEAKVDDKLIFAMSVDELAKLFGNSIGDLRLFRQILPGTASGAFPINESEDSDNSQQSSQVSVESTHIQSQIDTEKKATNDKTDSGFLFSDHLATGQTVTLPNDCATAVNDYLTHFRKFE